jgi:hypothetical protein
MVNFTPEKCYLLELAGYMTFNPAFQALELERHKKEEYVIFPRFSIIYLKLTFI